MEMRMEMKRGDEYFFGLKKVQRWVHNGGRDEREREETRIILEF